MSHPEERRGNGPPATPAVVDVSDYVRRTTVVRVLIGAFVIKAVLLFVVLPVVSGSVAAEYSIGFSDLYDAIGDNVARGLGYRVESLTTETMIREPGYPLFLAGLFTLGGYHIETARAANLVLAAGIAIMMMRLTRVLGGGERTALVAILLFIFHPGEMVSEARGGIEIVFIFVVMVFMLVLHEAMDKGRSWRYMLAGATLGLVCLFRGSPMFFPAFLLGYLVLVAPTAAARWHAGFSVAVLVLAMFVVIAPWAYRNYQLAGRLVLTATVQGTAAQEGQFTCENLWGDRDFRQLQTDAGNVRNEFARQLGSPFRGFYYQLFYSPADEMRFNDGLLSSTAGRYRENPLLLARCVGQNLLFNFWFLGKSKLATSLNVLVQLPFLIVVLGGVYISWKRDLLPRMAVIIGFSLYLVAVHVLVIAHARHSVPIMPFLSILASVALITWWRALETTLGRRASHRS